MLRLMVLISLTLALFSVEALAQNKPFLSFEGRFSIDLPGTPGEVLNAKEKTAGGKKLGWRNKESFLQ
jgi:hypothetical protein